MTENTRYALPQVLNLVAIPLCVLSFNERPSLQLLPEAQVRWGGSGNNAAGDNSTEGSASVSAGDGNGDGDGANHKVAAWEYEQTNSMDGCPSPHRQLVVTSSGSAPAAAAAAATTCGPSIYAGVANFLSPFKERAFTATFVFSFLVRVHLLFVARFRST